MTTQEQKYWK